MIRFSVIAIVLINTIDLACVWIIPRFFIATSSFFQLPEYIKNTFVLVISMLDLYSFILRLWWAHVISQMLFIR